MPIIDIVSAGKNCLYGLWEITERLEVLESMITLNDHEKDIFTGFRNETRKKHWLSYRLLFRRMLGSQDVDLRYMDSGKPYMVQPNGYISVTHSGCYSAVIYSISRRVGIDIERIHEKIDRVAHKFLSDTEQSSLGYKDRLHQLVIYWAAKESLYKLLGKSGVDFRKHLFIHAFRAEEKGFLRARSHLQGETKDFELSYKRIGEYFLVWVQD